MSQAGPPKSSAQVIMEESTEMECQPVKAKATHLDPSTRQEAGKVESRALGLGRVFPLKSLPNRKQFSPFRLLPSLIVIQACILVLFCVNFVCFFLSLSTVTSEEARMHNQKANGSLYSESKYLSLVVITLVSFPFHIFGMVAVTKSSFTLTLTYSIISFILLCLQLRSALSLEPGYYLTLWFAQFGLFFLVTLFVTRLYCEKIRKIDLL